MAYIYQTYLELRPEDVDKARLGHQLGDVLAYMRAVLPDEPGFVTSRVMVSMLHDQYAHVVLESVWDNWQALTDHLEKSHFVESKFLPQFEMDVEPQEIKSAIYEEVD